MEKQVYPDRRFPVAVSFQNGSVHIINDQQLWELLSEDMEARTAALVTWIKDQYRNLLHQELDISDDSLIMEIWGHVYFDYYVQAVKELVPIELVCDFLNRINKVSEVIDCGERGVDNNRSFWDMLAMHKTFILDMLPGKIDPEQHRDA